MTVSLFTAYLVTVLGFAAILLPVPIVIYLERRRSGQAPNWTPVIAAIGAAVIIAAIFMRNTDEPLETKFSEALLVVVFYLIIWRYARTGRPLQDPK